MSKCALYFVPLSQAYLADSTKLKDPNDPKAQWSYCPSLGAAILFTILFGSTTCAHVAQAVIYRKKFCWVVSPTPSSLFPSLCHHRKRVLTYHLALQIIMGSLWEFVGFILRDLSVQNQTQVEYYLFQQLLVLLAPLWINAFAYMVLGRMVHTFVPGQKVMGIKARRLTLYFVLLDITCVHVTHSLLHESQLTDRKGVHGPRGWC